MRVVWHPKAREEHTAIADKRERAAMIPSEDVLAKDLKDPEFRVEWERTAVARAIALTVLDYRTRHGLSQRALATELGVRQPQIARLESGDHHPTMETLRLLSSRLGLEIAIVFTPPARRESALAAQLYRRKNAITEAGEAPDGSRIVVMASSPRRGSQHASRSAKERRVRRSEPAAV